MKVFSKEKFIEVQKERGNLEAIHVQYALNTWVRMIDGQQVRNGYIRWVSHRRELVHRKRRDREIVKGGINGRSMVRYCRVRE